MKRAKGYTLIELLMVVAIIGILASIVSPRLDLFTQKAVQATTKNNLGSIRSGIALYYSDHEGVWPLSSVPDGMADFYGISLAGTLMPKYMEKIPTPRLLERIVGFNELALDYDTEARNNMSATPQKDVYVLRAPRGYTPFVNRPWVYNPDDGSLYICNGNYDTTGGYFFDW